MASTPLRVDPIHAARAFLAFGDERSLFQLLQMLRDSRARHRQPSSEPAHRHRLARQSLEDQPPRGIAEGGEAR